MLETLVTIIHVGAALFMILVVLVQSGHSGGVGAAFGGGNSSGVFGATGATSILGKLTYGAATVFMITSISLTMMQGKSGNIGISDKIKERNSSSTAPASTETAPPAAADAPATAPAQPTTGETAPAAAPTEGQK